jgi:hypothetical protein
MAGVNPAYFANQAGHSLKMILEVYAKWIPSGHGGNEQDRLSAALAGNSSPDNGAQKRRGPAFRGEDEAEYW